MNAITVNELSKICLEQIAKGNGAKQIIISNDDEGNGYHSLFYGFTDDLNTIKQIKDFDGFHDGNNPNDIVILG